MVVEVSSCRSSGMGKPPYKRLVSPPSPTGPRLRPGLRRARVPCDGHSGDPGAGSPAVESLACWGWREEVPMGSRVLVVEDDGWNPFGRSLIS